MRHAAEKIGRRPAPVSGEKPQARRRRTADAPQRLFVALSEADASAAVKVMRDAVSSGSGEGDRSEVFDTTLAPALALLGESWAKRDLDDDAFAQAGEIAEQLTSFAASPAPSLDVTVAIGVLRGDVHDANKNIIASVIRSAGYTVVDLGAGVRPVEFLERVEESGADVVVACAETLAAARFVRELRTTLDAGGYPQSVLLASGGPFRADRELARSMGANGVIRGAGDAVRAIERSCELIASRPAPVPDGDVAS